VQAVQAESPELLEQKAAGRNLAIWLLMLARAVE
jgi:hypothetical protein